MNNNLHSFNLSVSSKETEHICSDCRSAYGPAAYMVKLLEVIEKYTSGTRTLRKRRADLYSMKLSCESIDKEKSYLEIMIQKIKSDNPAQTGFDRWMSFFAKEEIPFFLNENLPLKALRAYLHERSLHLENLYELSDDSSGWKQESIAALLGLSNQTSYVKKQVFRQKKS